MIQINISVIMAAYKETPAEVRSAVQNMLEQSYPPLEVVLVLDNPVNTAVRNMLEEWQWSEARLKVVVHEKNQGLGAALNTATVAASGEWLARMDVGDHSATNRLEKQVAHLAQYPQTDLLFTGWQEVYEDGSTRSTTPNRAEFADITKYFFIKSIILHASLLIRREILLEHPYPEIDRPEDFVLFLKLMRTGYHFDIVEEVLYSYNIDRSLKYKKIRIFSGNLLPRLFINIPYYWNNIWFWIYTLRVFGEYLISRNEYVFNLAHHRAVKLWRKIIH